MRRAFKSFPWCQPIHPPGCRRGGRSSRVERSVVARELSVRFRPITPAAAGIHRRSLKCAPNSIVTAFSAFEPMSKRRRGFPSETQVKQGLRTVHGDKTLEEKLGLKDP